MDVLEIEQAGEVDACCSVLDTATASSTGAATGAAAMFKALGDPTRIRLLSIVAGATDGEVCVCDLTEPVGLSQPTVSHHLKILTEAGFLRREKRGTWAYYSIVPGSLERISPTQVVGGVASARLAG